MSTLATVIYHLRNLLSTDDAPDVNAARDLLHSELVEAALERDKLVSGDTALCVGSALVQEAVSSMNPGPERERLEHASRNLLRAGIVHQSPDWSLLAVAGLLLDKLPPGNAYLEEADREALAVTATGLYGRYAPTEPEMHPAVEAEVEDLRSGSGRTRKKPAKLQKRTRFPTPQPIVGPGHMPGVWNIDLYISDRWGDTSDHGGWVPHDVAERLRSKMWDEVCFMAEKDGKLGVLFEVEKLTVESIKWHEPDAEQGLLKDYYPAAVLPRVLCKALPILSAEFPGVEFAVSTSELETLGALLWAFVADDLNMDEETCERLGLRLLYLDPDFPEKQPERD